MTKLHNRILLSILAALFVTACATTNADADTPTGNS